jgi:DNA-binding MarR family transcriptional regulator
MTRSKDETHRRNVTSARSGKPVGGDRASSSLGFLLSQVGIYASRRFAQRLSTLDLQPPEFRVLNVVAAAEGLSQQAIAEAIQAPASRMVAIVDELEESGLVERRQQPGDRRVHALYLTDEGREVLAKGRRIAAEHEAELTRGMSVADRKRLVSLLGKIVESQEIGAGVHPGLSAPEVEK